MWPWLAVACVLGLAPADPRVLLLAPFSTVAMLVAGNLGLGVVEPGDDDFMFLLLCFGAVGLSCLALGRSASSDWRRLRTGRARTVW